MVIFACSALMKALFIVEQQLLLFGFEGVLLDVLPKGVIWANFGVFVNIFLFFTFPALKYFLSIKANEFE